MDMLAKMINLLQEQGKKQKDLTDYLGLSKNTFTGWKRGDNASYLKYAKQIADYLGVSVNYLLAGNTHPEDADQILRTLLWGKDAHKVSDETLESVRMFAAVAWEQEQRRHPKNEG